MLELIDLDNSEIHIDDVQKKAPSEEEMQMIRRVEEPLRREDVLLPKDAAGEAMISGEASDDDEEDDVDDDDDSDDDQSSDDFSDKVGFAYSPWKSNGWTCRKWTEMVVDTKTW